MSGNKRSASTFLSYFSKKNKLKDTVDLTEQLSNNPEPIQLLKSQPQNVSFVISNNYIF